MTVSERVTCCVAGGGPAGAVVGLLLARAGVQTLVLEKHADFLRDFRGDTIHPSTLALLDELGLGEQLARLPLRHSETVSVVADDGEFTVADFRRLPGQHVLAFLPQWDFLDLLFDEARALPGFELRMRAEVTELLRRDDRVTGVRYRDAEGNEREVSAVLVIGTDGRDSTVRTAADLRPRAYGAPMDVLWFRLSRHEQDPSNLLGRFSAGYLLVMIDRGEYWQVAYLVPKDGYGPLRRAGIETLRRSIAELAPFLADRVDELAGWDDVRLLRVQVDRLRRWSRSGVLCIGDAAHAMSPIGGVGINLAVQDAVAAARILAEPLRSGHLGRRHLARVQARRTVPTVLTQWGQRAIQRRFLAPLLSGRNGGRAPVMMRLLDRHERLRVIPAWLIGRGVLPEHAPRAPRLLTDP